MIESVLNKLFPAIMLANFNAGVREGERNENLRQYIQRKEIRSFELQQYIGKKIIVISNEWQDPYVGTGLRLEFFPKDTEPFLVSVNALTGEEQLHFGKVIDFTPEILKAMTSISPFERWRMMTGQKIDRTPPEGAVLKTYAELMFELREKNFIKD